MSIQQFVSSSFKITAIIIVATLITACAIFENPNDNTFDITNLYKVVPVDATKSKASFVEYNKNIDEDNELKNTFLGGNIDQTYNFIKSIQRNGNIELAILEGAKISQEKAIDWLAISFALYPSQQQRLLDSFYNHEIFTQEEVLSAGLKAGIDPAHLETMTSSGDAEDRVTPLIHSLSVTLFNVEQEISNLVEFKKTDSEDDHWNSGYNLQWDPIERAYSGSIVHLSPETDYSIRITLLDLGQPIEVREFQAKTRPNQPPVNPNLVYKLEDIYSGGQLDLSALNIKGEPDGWAKIIGDGQVIDVEDDFNSAVNLGSQSYIILEDFVVRGGARHGIFAQGAHHIWIKGCDISNWGRVASVYKKGKGFASSEDNKPINYDAGIYLRETGTVTVEDCEIHSPNGHANNWGSGHPNGPAAMLISAKHSNKNFEGQYIIRNNRFYGTDKKRFNDVIEGTGNVRRNGGFVRDSAIYGNYLAFANDDLIELDGGQSNVLFYNNEVTQGYCGVSVAPNMKGPSYIFNNYIHSLGDDRGKMWVAIKMGGLRAAPAGVTNIFNNKIVADRNGIGSAGVRKDTTFFANAFNNIIINSKYYRTNVGFGVIEKEANPESIFLNNFIFNTRISRPNFRFSGPHFSLHELSTDRDSSDEFSDSDNYEYLCVEPQFSIQNFSKIAHAEHYPLCRFSIGANENEMYLPTRVGLIPDY